MSHTETKKRSRFRLPGFGKSVSDIHGVAASDTQNIGLCPELEEIIQKHKTNKKTSRLLPVGSDRDLYQNMIFRFTVGSHCDQGGRKYMEDRYICIDNVKEISPDTQYPQGDHFAFFAVYDGHAGFRAADICKESLHKIILDEPEFGSGNVTKAIQDGLTNMDKQIIEKGSTEGWTEGCCVSLLMLIDNVLYTANLGDSHIVLSQMRSTIEGVILSETHKASEPSEKQRITEAGGMVMKNRVFGDLSISRALGDLNYKQPKQEANYVSDQAYIQKTVLSPINEFLIVASDGLWDTFTFQEAVEYVYHHRKEDPNTTPQAIAKLLLSESQKRGSQDNISIIVIFFIWG